MCFLLFFHFIFEILLNISIFLIESCFLLLLRVFLFQMHQVKHKICRFSSNHFLDSDSVDIFSFFHFEIKLSKIVGVWDCIHHLSFGRHSIPNKSSGNFTHLKVHYLLQIYVPEIINDPFDFDMVNVDSRCHVKVMYYFMGHQIYVILRLVKHQMMTNFINCVRICVSFIKLRQSS